MPAKSKPSTRPSTKAPEVSSVEPLVESLKSPYAALAEVQRMLKVARETNTVSQDLLALLKELDTLAKQVSGATKTITETLFEVRAKGVIESGPILALFSESEQRRPSWKEVAIDRARMLAYIRNEIFVEDTYVRDVQASTDPTIVRSVKLVPNGLND